MWKIVGWIVNGFAIAAVLVFGLWVLVARSQTSGCMNGCGYGFPSCEGTLEIRDRLDDEARARGWTDEWPRNYWQEAAAERRKIEQDYCTPTRCKSAGVDERLCQQRSRP